MSWNLHHLVANLYWEFHFLQKRVFSTNQHARRFVHQIFKNLLVFVVIYTFRPDLVTTESLLNKRNSELQLNRRQRSLGQWLRPMSLRAPLEYSKDWLWSLCKWNENERSFSFSSKRDTSFPGHKPPYFVKITVFSTNLESISGGWAASEPK